MTAKNKVTIVSISYNHEKYIAKTLESFVAQRTNFNFEIIISDDSSSDITQSIIKEYADKYPYLIKPIYRKQNIGALNNFIDTLSIANSQYLIYCEGDDYFTDPLKLQKQVDYLDANPECAICFHPVQVLFENRNQPDYIFPSKKQYPFVYLKKYMQLKDLLIFNFIQTNSCMYRWRFNNGEKIEEIFPRNILPGDWFLHLLHAEKGKIGFINEIMSVYRIHDGGLWYNPGSDSFWQKNGFKYMAFFDAVKKHFQKHVNEGFEIDASKEYLKILLKIKDFEQIKLFSETFVDCYESTIENIPLLNRIIASLKYRTNKLYTKFLCLLIFMKGFFKK